VTSCAALHGTALHGTALHGTAMPSTPARIAWPARVHASRAHAFVAALPRRAALYRLYEAQFVT
jgi:hypothetical protein